MQMLEIIALDNGAHNNQTYHRVLPEGWAIIRENVSELENFPFGSFDVDYINNTAYMVSGSWVPGEMPEPEPEPEEEMSVWDELDAAYQEGVNSVE